MHVKNSSFAKKKKRKGNNRPSVLLPPVMMGVHFSMVVVLRRYGHRDLNMESTAMLDFLGGELFLMESTYS